MLFSYKISGAFLSKLWWCFSFMNALTLFAFLGLMCNDTPKQAINETFLIVIALGATVGIAHGLYVMFCTKFSSLYAIAASSYLIISLEIMFAGSGTALAMMLTGRPDLRWFAFSTNAACVILALLIGILQEAARLGLLKGENRWRENIGKYLDFSKRLVDPALTTKADRPTSMDAISITAGIGVNIPLLFQIYGGGRDNAIFLAAPLLTLTFFYLNYKTFGPGLTRIFLLRKIEKEQGYRFQNADYEKIQELRRGFFLSRWLMKDYQLPIAATTLAKSDKETMQKRNRRHKG